VTTRVTGVSPGLATCAYAAPGVRVNVSIDTNPQALRRFSRAVVERGQVAVWSGRHGHLPHLLNGIGQGADWFPDDRDLLTTDGRRLIDVKLVRTALSARARLRLARAVALATLGEP
jgi:hypothetical protein